MNKSLRVFPASVFATAIYFSFAGCGADSLKHYNLGVEAAEKGDLQEAVEHWTESLKKRPDDSDAHYNMGNALIELGRFSEAEKHLRMAAEIMPGDHEIHYSLGKAREKQDLLSEAKNAYNMSISVNSNYYPPYIGLASIALRQQQYKTAEKYAMQGLEVSPKDLQGNLILAEAFFLQGNLLDAYSQLLSVRGMYASNPDYLLLMGKIMSERNMHADAISNLKLAKENGVSGSDVFLYLGKSSYALGQYSDAEKYFGLAAYKDPSDARPLMGLADTYISIRKYDKSMEAWENAARLSPDDPEIDLGIAIVLINTQRSDSASAILEKMSREENAPPTTLYYLGHALLRSGLNERAREAFREFIAAWEGDRRLVDEVNGILEAL